jgi:hypothetical protein
VIELKPRKEQLLATYSGSQPTAEFLEVFEKTLQENKEAAAQLLQRIKNESSSG